MRFNFSRRSLMKGLCSTAALSAAAVLPSAAADTASEYKGPHGPGMPQEGPNTPRICAPIDGHDITTESMRRIKQLGVDNVLMGGPRMPWQEPDLQATMDKLKTGGLGAGNMMIAGFDNCIYGRPGEARDKEIEDFKSSVRAAGKVGLPVVEYNWYAHRAIEGYYQEEGRGGAGLTAFNINKVENLPTVPEEGMHSNEELWKNITYFLQAVTYLRAIECAARAAS